jgi:hypothetical protein
LLGKHPAFSRLDYADHSLINGCRYSERFAQTRDRAVDGVDLKSAAGIIVQQHRWPRVGNFAAEFSDVLDGIADVEPNVQVAVSAPPLWLWRLAGVSGLVPSIPVFRSVRD